MTFDPKSSCSTKRVFQLVENSVFIGSPEQMCSPAACRTDGRSQIGVIGQDCWTKSDNIQSRDERRTRGPSGERAKSAPNFPKDLRRGRRRSKGFLCCSPKGLSDATADRARRKSRSYRDKSQGCRSSSNPTRIKSLKSAWYSAMLPSHKIHPATVSSAGVRSVHCGYFINEFAAGPPGFAASKLAITSAACDGRQQSVGGGRGLHILRVGAGRPDGRTDGRTEGGRGREGQLCR